MDILLRALEQKARTLLSLEKGQGDAADHASRCHTCKRLTGAWPCMHISPARRPTTIRARLVTSSDLYIRLYVPTAPLEGF